MCVLFCQIHLFEESLAFFRLICDSTSHLDMCVYKTKYYTYILIYVCIYIWWPKKICFVQNSCIFHCFTHILASRFWELLLGGHHIYIYLYIYIYTWYWLLVSFPWLPTSSRYITGTYNSFPWNANVFLAQRHALRHNSRKNTRTFLQITYI